MNEILIAHRGEVAVGISRAIRDLGLVCTVDAPHRPIREAFKPLLGGGPIEARPRRGAVVALAWRRAPVLRRRTQVGR